MRITAPIVVIALAASLVLHAAPTKKQLVNYDLTGWHNLEMSQDSITASGGSPLVTSSDGKLRLSASKVVLTLVKGKDSRTISTAEAFGSVRLHAVPGQGQALDAVCQKAVIRPADQRADLIGNVTVRKAGGDSGPAELSGDTVTLYLKDGRVLATSKTAKSRLKVTPKSGEKP
jgi:lipopolysaccharide transport protein LptA